MRLNYLKQKIQGWIPQQPSNHSTKLRHYSTPIVILAVTIFSLSLFVVSSTFFFEYSAVRQLPVNTNVDNSTIPTIAESTVIPQENLNKETTQNNSLLSEDQALSIALPIIQQYAEENNRKIDSVNATLTHGFWKVSANFQWSGPPSLVPVYDENGTVTAYKDPTNPQLWIFGYVIDIRPDSGEIFYSEAQGVM